MSPEWTVDWCVSWPGGWTGAGGRRWSAGPDWLSICPINVYNDSNYADHYNDMFGTNYYQPGLIMTLPSAYHLSEVYFPQPYTVRGLTAGQALSVSQGYHLVSVAITLSVGSKLWFCPCQYQCISLNTCKGRLTMLGQSSSVSGTRAGQTNIQTRFCLIQELTLLIKKLENNHCYKKQN